MVLCSLHVSNLNIVLHYFLGRHLLSSLLVIACSNAKPNTDLVVENECPDKTKDQLQVATFNVSSTYKNTIRVTQTLNGISMALIL